MKDRYDILIIGGGIIGSSIAMSIANKKGGRIAILDPDLSGIFSSSENNAGGVRATWWDEVNIHLSLHSIKFFEKIAGDVGFRQDGYLWLHGSDTWRKAKTMIAFQNRFGLNIEDLSPADITRRIPEIDNISDIAGATFSPMDGLINPNLLRNYYRKRAEEMGVEFLDRILVKRIILMDKRVIGVECARLMAPDEIVLEEILTSGRPYGHYTNEMYGCNVLINTAGAWAPTISRMYDSDLPSYPLRRQVSVTHSPDVDLSGYGMIVDTSGLYFHPEAGNILAGYSIPDEPPGYNFKYDGYDFFLKEIWPRLYNRISRLERLGHIRGWAGLYEVSKDKSAIIGRVSGLDNVYEAHSFSGRGVMQSYAAGLALAELIIDGRYLTVDLTSLSGSRFKEGKEMPEVLHI
ncbi:MAG TPA: FAD-binding oxidoreductase [Nitrospiria bacterium]|nr:FAD-binding oxidoreductase [Nitrospiria bacterium]